MDRKIRCPRLSEFYENWFKNFRDTFKIDSSPSILLSSHMYFLIKTEFLPNYYVVSNRILGHGDLYTKDEMFIVNQYEVLSTSFIVISVTAIDCAK